MTKDLTWKFFWQSISPQNEERGGVAEESLFRASFFRGIAGRRGGGDDKCGSEWGAAMDTSVPYIGR